MNSLQHTLSSVKAMDLHTVANNLLANVKRETAAAIFMGGSEPAATPVSESSPSRRMELLKAGGMSHGRARKRTTATKNTE